MAAQSYGFQTALHVSSVTLFVMTVLLLYFVKHRLPIAPSSSVRPFDFSLLWTRTFLIFELGNIIEALGVFLPTIYLRTYASRTLGTSNLISSLTIILLNLASIFGYFIMGTMVDRYHVTTCILISTIGSTVAVFVIWGFSLNLAPPVHFLHCIQHLRQIVLVHLARYLEGGPEAEEFGRINHHVCLPGHGERHRQRGQWTAQREAFAGLSWRDADGWAYSSGYGTLIVFTSVTAALAGRACWHGP
jgi:Na+/melibiose symporter-like transporter